MASSARSAQPSLVPGRFAARVLPAFLVLLLSAGYAAWVLSRADWDPRVFADLGSRYALGQVNGSEGYDGQLNYFIALDPRPQFVASRLDVPAYRCQRILYPLPARVVSGGNPTILPWALLGTNLVAVAVAMLLTSELLRNRGASPWDSIPFGLWVGLLGSLRTDLSEPLAFALVALAILLDDRGLPAGSGLLLALAAFAKETTSWSSFWCGQQGDGSPQATEGISATGPASRPFCGFLGLALPGLRIAWNRERGGPGDPH